MVIVADDAPAAEACICKPCSAGDAQGRIIKFGSRKHNPAWSLSVAQLVVELTISRRANDTKTMSDALLLRNNLDNLKQRRPTCSAQLHLPTHDLLWAKMRVQLHLPPLKSLDLLISPGTLHYTLSFMLLNVHGGEMAY